MEPTARVRHAVIPAAGFGTRFLPATKATPKEMLPVVDKPAIQYVVEEAVTAGLANVLVVTGRNKRPLEDHFDRNYELEATLRAKGDLARLGTVQYATDLAHLHFVRQGDPLGLGHAVLCARHHIGGSPFAVLLGDDLIDPRDPLLRTMIDVYEATGRSVVALMEVPAEKVHLYGCAAVAPAPPMPPAAGEATGGTSVSADTAADGADDGATAGEATAACPRCDVVAVTGLVEKPSVAEAPSNLAVIGRYVLSPRIFEILEHTAPGRSGEIQLTDALAALTEIDPADGGGVLGVVFRGRRYDTGDRLEYLKTVVTLASERADLAAPFLEWLAGFVARRATGRVPDPASPNGAAGAAGAVGAADTPGAAGAAGAVGEIEAAGAAGASGAASATELPAVPAPG